MVKRTSIGVALMLAALAAPAAAADLAPLYGQDDDFEAAPPVDYTFGTGWYLRGDLTATADTRPDVLGTLPSRSDHRDWNYGVGGGVGYRYNAYVRGDITADYLGPQKTVDRVYGDGVSFALKSNLHRYDALANGYFDLGTWGGLTPYIGAGVGFAGVGLDGSYEYNAPFTGTSASYKVQGKTRYQFAWAAMAGVSYNLSQNLVIDVGYRYLDLGTYKVPQYVYSPFNSGYRADLNSHQIRAGLRYMIY